LYSSVCITLTSVTQTVPLVTGNRYIIKNGTLTHVETRHSKRLWSPTMTDTKQLYLYIFTDLLLITKKKKYVVCSAEFG